MLFWIFQEIFLGKLFSYEEEVVWQTGSGTTCCLSVVGLGVLGVFPSAQSIGILQLITGGAFTPL